MKNRIKMSVRVRVGLVLDSAPTVLLAVVPCTRVHAHIPDPRAGQQQVQYTSCPQTSEYRF